MWPIIVDADDLIVEPRISNRLAEAIAIDGTKLKFSWAPIDKEELEKMSAIPRRMLSTLIASDSIQKDMSAANINIDEEARKWKEEFGESHAQKIEKWVRDAMPDYEYLKERRMRLTD